MTTEFHSDALTNEAIRPWVQLALRANFVELLQFHHLLSVTFHFDYCLCQLPHLFELKVSWGNHVSGADELIHIVFCCFVFFCFFFYSLFNIDLQYLQYQTLSNSNINPNLYTNTNRQILQWKVNYFFEKYIMLLDDIKLVNN